MITAAISLAGNFAPLPGRVLRSNTRDLERQIGAFVDYYNNERYHESLNNVTPAGVYFGRDKAIIRERAKIKKLTIPLSGSCCA